MQTGHISLTSPHTIWGSPSGVQHVKCLSLFLNQLFRPIHQTSIIVPLFGTSINLVKVNIFTNMFLVLFQNRLAVLA